MDYKKSNCYILDEDRKINAQKFENAFYTKTTDLRNVKPPEEVTPTLDAVSLLAELSKSPEFLARNFEKDPI